MATQTAPVEEIIEDGVHGLLVPPNDPNALAEAILRLLRDPLYAGSLAERAQDRAHCFSWNARAARLVEFSHDLLGRS